MKVSSSTKKKSEVVAILMDIRNDQKEHRAAKSHLEKAIDDVSESFPGLTVRQRLKIKILFQDKNVAEFYLKLSLEEKEVWVDDELARV